MRHRVRRSIVSLLGACPNSEPRDASRKLSIALNSHNPVLSLGQRDRTVSIAAEAFASIRLRIQLKVFLP